MASNSAISDILNYTTKHVGVGIKKKDSDSSVADLYLTNADGTTQTKTLVTTVSDGQYYKCFITWDQTEINLYINGVLEATHTTNIPTFTSTTYNYMLSTATNDTNFDSGISSSYPIISI